MDVKLHIYVAGAIDKRTRQTSPKLQCFQVIFILMTPKINSGGFQCLIHDHNLHLYFRLPSNKGHSASLFVR